MKRIILRHGIAPKMDVLGVPVVTSNSRLGCHSRKINL